MRRAIALALSIALATAPLPALADTKEKPPATAAQKQQEARARYERGLKLYDEGAYDAALVEMQRAYELAPSFKILYNLGLVHKQLNDYAASLRAFQQYLAEGGAKVPAARRAEVEKTIGELKARVASVTVEVDVSGAEVTVDDAPVGTSPLAEPVLVNAGKRKISAKVAGKPAATRVITVAGNDTVTVKLELAEPQPTAPKGDPQPSSPAPPSTPETPAPAAKPEVPWVLWGITGGLAVAAGVSGVIAFGSSRSLADKRDTPNASRAELDDARARTKTWALVTDVLLVGTVVAAGVSVYFTFAATPSASKKDASTTLQVGVGPTGLSLSGSF